MTSAFGKLSTLLPRKALEPYSSSRLKFTQGILLRRPVPRCTDLVRNMAAWRVTTRAPVAIVSLVPPSRQPGAT